MQWQPIRLSSGRTGGAIGFLMSVGELLYWLAADKAEVDRTRAVAPSTEPMALVGWLTFQGHQNITQSFTVQTPL